MKSDFPGWNGAILINFTAVRFFRKTRKFILMG